MQAPSFWHQPSMTGTLLSPLSIFWHAGTMARRFFAAPPFVASVPVICVGNFTAGGAGKTPLVIDFARALCLADQKPHLLTRGFGGSLRGPVLVDRQSHVASEVGDEPLLLAANAPTWVSHNRAQGARQATKNGASIIIMDDGFQNPTIVKTLSIIAVDGGYGFGNGKVIPAGPLRESVKAGLRRCDAVIIIGDDRHNVEKFLGSECPIYRAKIVPSPTSSNTEKKVVAFAGISRPSKFYETLSDLGYEVVGKFDFADHHKFKEEEITKICNRAQKLGATPITTEKDHARLPMEVRAKIKVIKISIEWEDCDARESILKKVIENG